MIGLGKEISQGCFRQILFHGLLGACQMLIEQVMNRMTDWTVRIWAFMEMKQLIVFDRINGTINIQ